MKADTFNLVEYLSKNILLENKLSPEEQDIVDDILSVNEGFEDIMNKIKSYAKKGLLTTAILFAVINQLKAQGQTDTANQVQKAAQEITINISKSTSPKKENFVYSGKHFIRYIYDPTSRSQYEREGAYEIVIYSEETNFTDYVGLPSYKTSDYNYHLFSNKEDLITFLKTGLKLLEMDPPAEDQVYTASVEDGAGDPVILRRSGKYKDFVLFGYNEDDVRLYLNKRAIKKFIPAVENFNP